MLTDMTPTAGQLYGAQIPAMTMNIANMNKNVSTLISFCIMISQVAARSHELQPFEHFRIKYSTTIHVYLTVLLKPLNRTMRACPHKLPSGRKLISQNVTTVPSRCDIFSQTPLTALIGHLIFKSSQIRYCDVHEWNARERTWISVKATR